MRGRDHRPFRPFLSARSNSPPLTPFSGKIAVKRVSARREREREIRDRRDSARFAFGEKNCLRGEGERVDYTLSAGRKGRGSRTCVSCVRPERLFESFMDNVFRSVRVHCCFITRDYLLHSRYYESLKKKKEGRKNRGIE